MKKGKLVLVQIGPGQYRKMYEADAIKAGHIKPKENPQEKALPPAQNKMRLPEQDKAVEKPPAPEPADDFTAISGVGKATARALLANGITSFEQLRNAGNLDYLSDQVNQAIREWRNG